MKHMIQKSIVQFIEIIGSIAVIVYACLYFSGRVTNLAGFYILVGILLISISLRRSRKNEKK